MPVMNCKAAVRRNWHDNAENAFCICLRCGRPTLVHVLLAFQPRMRTTEIALERVNKACVNKHQNIAASVLCIFPRCPTIMCFHRFDDQTSLVECKPKTGRTNQIRVHLSHLGFPIIGDPTYNSSGQPSQSLGLGEPPMHLHAYRVKLTHPNTREPLEIETSLPEWAKV